LTIERSDPVIGTINIVGQSAGKTTHFLNCLETDDQILDVVGPPLGKPSEIKKFGTVVVMGGGVGTAMACPTAAALKTRRQSSNFDRRCAQQGISHSRARDRRS
jgi:ferredoxin/flavodoxin---NADP+ reductase